MKNSHKACLTICFLLLGTIPYQVFGHDPLESDKTAKPAAHLAMMVIAADTVIPPEGEPAGNLIAGQSQPKLIAKQFSFTEGPAADKEGNIFFTDQPNDKIWKYGTDGQLSVFLDKAGRANGLYFDKKGNLVACADEQDQLWSISPEGKVTVLVKNFQGHRLNGPNDLWVAPKGGVYFTDPFYPRDYWDRKSPDPGIGGEKVYYLPKGKKEPVMVAGNLVKPNGIVGTPDGKYLYVADIKGNKTYKYRISADGTLKERQLFVEQGSDGMTLDERGNVYLTGDGVTIFNPEGKKLEHIPIPEGWTANVCFGGKDRNILFMTASEAIYTLPMQVKGVQ